MVEQPAGRRIGVVVVEQPLGESGGGLGGGQFAGVLRGHQYEGRPLVRAVLVAQDQGVDVVAAGLAVAFQPGLADRFPASQVRSGARHGGKIRRGFVDRSIAGESRYAALPGFAPGLRIEGAGVLERRHARLVALDPKPHRLERTLLAGVDGENDGVVAPVDTPEVGEPRQLLVAGLGYVEHANDLDCLGVRVEAGKEQAGRGQRHDDCLHELRDGCW